MVPLYRPLELHSHWDHLEDWPCGACDVRIKRGEMVAERLSGCLVYELHEACDRKLRYGE